MSAFVIALFVADREPLITVLKRNIFADSRQ